MQAAVKLSNALDFPEEINDYFKASPLSVKRIPETFTKIKEDGVCDIVISSVKQYYEFLQNELKFWTEKKQNLIGILACYNKLQNAMQNLNLAKTCFEQNDTYNGNIHLNRSIEQIRIDYLCSDTRLAKYLTEQKDKGKSYFIGFSYALQERVSIYQFEIGIIQGYYDGLVFLGEIKRASSLAKKVAFDFSDNLSKANENYRKLNDQFSDTFYANEKRIAEIQNLTDNEINNLKQQTDNFFKLKEQRSQELENLYENKLRLEKPATYWKDMATTYSKQGKRWLVASCITAGLIIAMLVLIIVLVPNLFSSDSHWFDIFKNSAIITVIASIAIYMLRMFVKMTMSSLHLSRDAKEREQLSYFYLALIESKAVTDKEKALIINSLFSRSDTGLLKGDSTPIMTANVGEIIDKLSKDSK